MLDDRLLEDFIQTFRGYGSFEAPWWFVGMEEGGGKDEEQIAKRLSAWASRGRQELEDLAEYHREFGITKFWSRNPPTQPTWRKLIRLKLTATLKQEDPVALEQIREYQRDHWGRRNDETCLLELLPLPSPDSNTWRYGSWSEIAQLANRESYREWLLAYRVEIIRRRIDEHCPSFVVFYGFGYSDQWRHIADIKMIKNEQIGFYYGESDKTTFFIVPHPASEWKNATWDSIGKSVAS